MNNLLAIARLAAASTSDNHVAILQSEDAPTDGSFVVFCCGCNHTCMAIASLKRSSCLTREIFQSQQGPMLYCWNKTTALGNPCGICEVTPILMIALICHCGFAITFSYNNNALLRTHCLASTDEDNGGMWQCMFFLLAISSSIHQLLCTVILVQS